MANNRIRDFYLWCAGLLAVVLNIAYLALGAVEGYGLPNLVECLYAAILAIIPTAIYYFLTYGSDDPPIPPTSSA
jgi:fructose-1,6-bisphosphatase/inositol monophosphatase family enzyme